MELRVKWISAHPPPPQDNDDFTDDLPSDGISPLTPLKHQKMMSEESQHRHLYRRRPIPVYDIFNQPLPAAISDMRFKMVNGKRKGSTYHIPDTLTSCCFKGL